MQRESMVSIF